MCGGCKIAPYLFGAGLKGTVGFKGMVVDTDNRLIPAGGRIAFHQNQGKLVGCGTRFESRRLPKKEWDLKGYTDIGPGVSGLIIG